MRRRGVEIPDEVLRPAPRWWGGDRGAPTLLMGGSFDPPHLGHLEIGRHIRDRLFGDAGRLVLVPAARSPHKTEVPGASPEDRVRMLEIASGEDPRVSVWTDELDRARAGDGAPSYWVETLSRAVSLLADSAPLRFLIGTDQAVAFHRWHDYERIELLAEPVVALRGVENSGALFETELRDAGLDAGRTRVWMSRVVEAPLWDVSSTEVRAGLRSGCDEGLEGLVGPGVLAYIREHALYAGGDDGC